MEDSARENLQENSTSKALTELALDLRSSFHHAADKLWEWLDPELWHATHNPWIVLQTVSPASLESVTKKPEFRSLLSEVHQGRRAFDRSEEWFQKTHANSGLKNVALFSMEFMLSEALPIYSGGLGNVAGDQLKAASDLAVPITGIGLLYQQGYFRQEIDSEGRQQAIYPYNDPGQLPISPLREKGGEWLRLRIDFPGAKLWLRTWEVRVGRAKLYLLDTNDPENLPSHRGIASELYGGDDELRLKQELVLGIGGWRLLESLGTQPEVCHLNEGHAAFVVLERAQSYMAANHVSFELALSITRSGNLFTTHTPVAAGFDRFHPELMAKYFKSYAENKLGIPFDGLLALGRRDPNDPAEPFNMAYLAVRGSGGVNGVSRLHGQVSRRIFQPLFARWPEAEVPVTHVTNGVHTPTWDSEAADRIWEKCCGKGRWRGELKAVDEDLRKVSDGELWQLRSDGLKALVEYIRGRHVRELAGRGASEEALAQAAQILDANTLTLGFARRFATYKRPTLLLHDRERLIQILCNRERPVQLVLAGKAHPRDTAGQAMVQEWVQFVQRPEVRPRVVFLGDYDALMAEHLVQGVDVWVNTPRRPWEASGTSGMKVLVNGGLNLSELDGWWAEAYSPEVGWALGDGLEHDSDPAWDAVEANTLYDLIENQIAPEFYERDERGISRKWVSRMRESMARLTPAFSTNRVVREYTEHHYLPAAAAFRKRAQNEGAIGKELLKWQQELSRHWSSIRFGTSMLIRSEKEYLFQVQVFLGDLDPNTVDVELYAEGRDGGGPAVQKMDRGDQLIGSVNGFVYGARIPASRPAVDYTPRVVPAHPDALIPLEAGFICWHDAPSWRDEERP
ncbi:MAG TPA: alpha-glucan family phosphorylase [Candidatus Dormibacteraeota bacterium]|nr:alpha-glucan family phosphorylase [Candidatus Dormibacteraeota bacterium]